VCSGLRRRTRDSPRPNTEEQELRRKPFTPAGRAASRRAVVPPVFTSTYSRAASMDERTNYSLSRRVHHEIDVVLFQDLGPPRLITDVCFVEPQIDRMPDGIRIGFFQLAGIVGGGELSTRTNWCPADTEAPATWAPKEPASQ